VTPPPKKTKAKVTRSKATKKLPKIEPSPKTPQNKESVNLDEETPQDKIKLERYYYF